MDRPIAAPATHPRVRRRLALAAAALGAGAAALLAAGERPARAATPLTLKTIQIDGSFADWDAVLANALQATRDGDGSSAAIKANCALYSTDRDCPQTGGSGNDFLTFAWTYDATHVYLYVERYGSTSNGVDFLFVADVDRDRRLRRLDAGGAPSRDTIVHANWFGGNGNVDLQLWSYDPADDVNGDPLVCTPVAPATACANAAGILAAPAGYVDGYELPGVNVSRRACPGCAGRGGADGLRVELAIPWAAFGTTVQAPFYWHAVSSNNDSLASTVDNIGAPDGGLGSFVQRGVALGPDRSGAVLSPGQVTYVHTLANEGNDQDLFDLAATSSQGAQLEVLEGGVVVGTDATGDGVWDSVRPGHDRNGDGRPDVALAAGEARALSLRITMPAGRSGQEVTRLTATGGNAPAVTATATDTSHVGTAAFVPVAHAAYTVAAQPLPFRESLVNGQASSDTFALTADAGCAGYRLELARDDAGNPGAIVALDADGDGAWDVVSADTDGDGLPDLGPVAGGTSSTFHLVVTPPGGTPPGARCTVALTAASPTSGATARATHAVAVERAVTFAPDHRGAVAGAADAADTQIPSGGTVFLPATIRNAEAVARSYALAQSQTGGGAAPRVWSDPDGDGNPSDGAPIVQTGALAAYGGTEHVVIELRAGAAPTGSFLVTTTTAAALGGGASAAQVSEAVVGFLAVFADALHADASNVFAPCATVHVEARGLLPGNVGAYALEWAPPSGPAPSGVSPWPTTARGTAEASLALGEAAALGAWTARLLEGGALKDDVAFSVVLPGAAPSVATDRIRYLPGEAVTVTASVRNDSAAPLEGTSLVYSGATSRTRAGVGAAPGATVADAFTFALPADAAPGPRTLTLGWRLACGAAPFLSASAAFEVAPPPPAIAAPAAGALVADATPAISGTAVPGAAVVVTVTDPLGDRTSPPVVADGTGAWSWTVPDGDALSEGAHSATAVQAAGGVSSEPSAAVAFAVDTVPPAAPAIASPASGTTTRVADVDVSGAAADPEAVAVEILVDGGVAATVPVVAGSFSATIAVADGTRAITARALDGAGNASAPSGAVSITVDTVPPAVPSLALGVASPTNLQPVPFAGTAEPLALVELVEGGVVIATVQAAGDGGFSASPALAEGAHAVAARATDAAGNVGPASGAVAVEVDRTAPDAPLVGEPTDGALLAGADLVAGEVRFTGTVRRAGLPDAEPFAVVALEVDGVPAGSTAADAAGAWSLAAAVADGAHAVRGRATDVAGNASGWSTATAFTLDTVAPGQPLLASPADGAALSALTIRVQGQVDADAVFVDLLEGGLVVATAAPSGGEVSFDLSRPEGPYAWALVARDAAGNASPASNSATVTVDRTRPGAAVVTAPAAGATVPGAGGVVFSGTAEPGATVSVTVDGATVTATVAGDGTWSVAVPAADGARTAAVVVSDRAGNASDPVAVAFVADSIAPPAPVIASPASGSATSAASATVSGTAEGGATVRILVDGVQVGTAVAAGGAFSATVPLPAGDGDAVVTAVAVDAAGNASPASAPVAVTVDRTAPPPPAFAAPSPTNLALVPVSGTAEAGATVEVLDGGVSVATTTALPDGTFSVGAPLGEGARTVSVVARDAAGNATAAGPATVVVDRTAPGLPSVVSPADSEVLGAADLVAGQVVFSGTAEPLALVAVEVDGVPAGTVAADPLGGWSLAATVAGGPHTVRAAATDAAGNSSGLGAAVPFTLDAIQPPTPVVESPAGPLATNALDLAVAGTAEPGAAVRIFLDGALVEEASADGLGRFSASVPLPGADGTVQLAAVAVDAGGNASAPTAAVPVVVDRTAPAAPAIDAPAEGAAFPPGEVEVRGRAEPGARVAVTVAGATETVTAAADGTWSVVVGVPAGEQTLSATQTDAAGNASPAAEVAVSARTDDGLGGGGCGCRSTGGATGPLALLALLALAPRRRRAGEPR